MIEKETQTKRHNKNTGKKKIIIDATGKKLYVQRWHIMEQQKDPWFHFRTGRTFIAQLFIET